MKLYRFVILCLLALSPRQLPAQNAGPDPLLWPEAQRAFYQDGPGLLLSDEEEKELLALDEAGREDLMRRILADPIPETEENELLIGIERRQRLVQEEFLSPLDDRARLLFLHGKPEQRLHVDCDQAYKPMEIWSYLRGTTLRELVLYRPRPTESFRLWLPLDSKRALYTEEMEYWLEQYEELRGRIRGKRFDLQICDHAKAVDAATGVEGLFGFAPNRPTSKELQRWLAPPVSRAEWSRRAAATAVPEEGPRLTLDRVEVVFPEKRGQRMVARLTITLPAGAPIEPFIDNDKPELRLNVEGVVEHDGRQFEDFRVRFQIKRPEKELPLALVLEQLLRPGQTYLIRFQLRDEVGGAESLAAAGFLVPKEPQHIEELPVPEEAIVALGESLAKERIPGRDSLVLVPPETEVVLGLWRAETLVTGERITKVVFLVDGVAQLSRSRPPFSAELRLATYPTEQVVRAEGYDEAGELVAADEIVLNQQRGELRVRIAEPKRGKQVEGLFLARAEIVVPEEKRVEQVEFRLNEELIATLTKPPWQTQVEMPSRQRPGDLVYLTVSALLDDGTRAEDVRFLNVPAHLEEVEVDLVELYTTVTDRNGRLARGLTQDDFRVWEDGRPQRITKFELVEDLPLTLGVTIDTSGSMQESLGEAQRAAIDFLHNLITPQDRCFAVAFSDRPVLLMPRTSDVEAVADVLEDLLATGMTSLHDAVVTSLYYFRGVRGRRALILLSDGEDTASGIGYREALEYARRSGVAIFTIGLDIGSLQFDTRNKLNELAKETGGRSFYIKQAAELMGVYDEIEEELRSQYLVAYVSDRPSGGDEEFREVEVKVRGSGLKARTIRGYYP